MDLLDRAIYDTAHDARGGLHRLAEKMGVNHQVLINKVNYNNEQNKVSLREAEKMMAITQNFSILEELARSLGFSVAPSDPSPEKSLLSAIINTGSDYGQVHQTIEAAIVDQRVNSKELRKISEEVDDAIEALHVLRATIEKSFVQAGN